MLMKYRMFTSAELTGRKASRMEILILKPLSGSDEKGREIFVVGDFKMDGVRAAGLGCDRGMGFERKASGGRTAAEAIVAVISTVWTMDFIVTIDEDLRALQLFALTERSSKQRWRTSHILYPVKPA